MMIFKYESAITKSNIQKLNHTKTLLYVSTTIFIIQGYMFRPFKRSSSGLLTD